MRRDLRSPRMLPLKERTEHLRAVKRYPSQRIDPQALISREDLTVHLVSVPHRADLTVRTDRMADLTVRAHRRADLTVKTDSRDPMTVSEARTEIRVELSVPMQEEITADSIPDSSRIRTREFRMLRERSSSPSPSFVHRPLMLRSREVQQESLI